jgi:glycosyltransferase involved in cell wall biosynthesis
LGNVPCVANSAFTAERYRTSFGVNPTVIYPFIAAAKYKTETTRENVTFINPHPVKGCDIALGIAAQCPEIPFTFVEGWRLSDDHRAQLLQRLAVLPNVTFLPPQSDMRAVYGKTKILLAPTGQKVTKRCSDTHKGTDAERETCYLREYNSLLLAAACDGGVAT